MAALESQAPSPVRKGRWTSATTPSCSGAAAILIAACALVAAVLGLVVAFLQTPEYQAGVMLQIEPPTPTFMTVTDALVAGAGATGRTPTSTTRSSRSCARRAWARRWWRQLKLNDQPPFKDNPDPGGLFMSHVGIDPIPESRLVMVSVTHTIPRKRRCGPTPWPRSTSTSRSSSASTRPRRPTSGSRSASPPPRTACARPRTSSSRATRARTCSCPRAASPRSRPRSPSSTTTTSPRRPAGSPSRRP